MTRGAAVLAAALALGAPAAGATPGPRALAPTDQDQVPREDGPALTLSQALDLGRRRAPELRAARARAASAAASVDERRAAYFPTLGASVSGGGAALRDTEPAPPPAEGRFAFVDRAVAGSGTLNLGWTVYDSGRTAQGVAAAAASRDAAAAGVAAADTTVAGAIAGAYATAHYKQALHDVARAVLAEREKLAAVARGLVKAGLQPPLEEIRADARVEAARVAVANADAAALDARATLAVLLGLDPQAPWRLTPPRLPAVAIPPADAAHLAAALPSVVAAAADAQASRASAAAAAARRLPTVALSADGSYTWTRHEGIDLLLDTRRVDVGLVVSVPLFDPSIAAGTARARADATTAAATADLVEREAHSEAVRAAIAVRTTAAALEHASRAADAAAVVLEVVEARYTRGLSSPIELIDAESADADSRMSRVDAALAHALAVVRLLTAVGRPIVEGNGEIP